MKTYASNLTSMPSWLAEYGNQTGKTLDADFGFDSDGMYFIGNAGDENPVVAYSVRTNFNISGHQACEVIFTADHTNSCSDQGICFYNDGQSPNWNWDPDPSRIAFSINCPVPNIYGTNKFANNSGEHYGSYDEFCGPGDCPEAGTPVLGPGIYTFKVTYDPAARTVTAITYEGPDTSGAVVDTIVLHEKLMGGAYRIGFDADNDGGTAYFTNLTINVYETNGISDDTELNNQLSNLKEAHSQITDLVEGALFNFSDDADLDDGSDPNFGQLGFGSEICIQDDGKIVVAGYSGTNDYSKNIRRIDVFGKEDESFTPPVFNGLLSSVVQMSDGRLVVGGFFTSFERFDGASNSGSITFDADYQGHTGINGNGIFLPPSASVVEVGWVVTFQDSSTRTVVSSYFYEPLNYWVVGFESNVTLDPAFPLTISQAWDPDIILDNQVIIGGMVCLNPDGSISKRNGGDIGFEDRAESIIGVSIYTIKLLDDDSVLVGGHFTHYDDVESPYLAKIDSDGVIDEVFAANILGLGISLSDSVSAIAVDDSGKILIGGGFDKSIIRLNGDGSLDISFDSGDGFTGQMVNGVFAILPLSSGKILVGHSGTDYDGSSCNRGLVRLNSDGSLDNTYTPDLYESEGFGFVVAIAQQENEKLLVGGAFDILEGGSLNKIVRLNTDGSLDESFSSGFGFTPAGYNWAPQTNDIKLDSVGNVYVAGNFTDYNHAARFQYAKLNANGALQPWSVLPAFKQMGIDDGMLDVYDGANFINTNLTHPYLDIKCNGGNDPISGGEGGCSGDYEKSIPSTHTMAWNGEVEEDFYDDSFPNELAKYRYQPITDSHVMVGDGYFGTGSSYFTAMFPGMFVLAANNISINQFSITGDIGSDGDGVDVIEVYPITVGESTYTAYLKSNYGSNGSSTDPSINHIIIVDGDGSGIEQFYDPTSEGDEHCLTGLDGKTKLFYLIISKGCVEDLNDEDCGNRMSATEVQNVAAKFLEIVATCGAESELDLSPDHPERLPNYKFYGEGNMDTSVVEQGGKRISLQRSGWLEVTDGCGGRRIVYAKDGQTYLTAPEVPGVQANPTGNPNVSDSGSTF